MIYRLSDYLIHAPIDGTEYEMLLHGYTGAVDIINRKGSTDRVVNICNNGVSSIIFKRGIYLTMFVINLRNTRFVFLQIRRKSQ